MTPELKRLDELLVAMQGVKLTQRPGLTCGACGKAHRTCVTDDAGHSICLDCYLVHNPAHGQQPTRHPQGDQLLSQPMQPKFVKKFS